MSTPKLWTGMVGLYLYIRIQSDLCYDHLAGSGCMAVHTEFPPRVKSSRCCSYWCVSIPQKTLDDSKVEKNCPYHPSIIHSIDNNYYFKISLLYHFLPVYILAWHSSTSTISMLLHQYTRFLPIHSLLMFPCMDCYAILSVTFLHHRVKLVLH